MLTDKQKQEVDNAIYEQVQENLNDLSVFEDYWHGITCSDGTVLDINIYDSDVDVVICSDGTLIRSPNQTGVRCDVYFADKEQRTNMNIDYSHWVNFESKHLDGIDIQKEKYNV